MTAVLQAPTNSVEAPSVEEFVCRECCEVFESDDFSERDGYCLWCMNDGEAWMIEQAEALNEDTALGLR